MPRIPRLQPKEPRQYFDPIGSFSKGYGLGEQIAGDIDVQKERERQEQGRNYFGQAVEGDKGATMELAKSHPELVQALSATRQFIDSQDDPTILKRSAEQMKTAAKVAFIGAKSPELWNEARPVLTKTLGFDPGGFENAAITAKGLAGGANQAGQKADTVQSSKQLAGGVTQKVYTSGRTEITEPTPEEAEIIRKAEERGVDIQQRRAQARGLGTGTAKIADKALDQTEKLRSNNLKLKKVIAEVGEGAETGPIANRLPSFRAATRRLIQIKNELGLDVIGSVTFGALSEGEMNLAMDTALPTGLQGPELVKWAQDKINAQEKLADYFEKQAVFLSKPGNTAADWLVKVREAKPQQPANVGRFQIEVVQ